MRDMLRFALDLHKTGLSDQTKDEIVCDLYRYLLDRFVEDMKGAGHRHDRIEAVIAPLRKSRPTMQTLLNSTRMPQS